MTKTLKIVFQMSCRDTFGLQTGACFCQGRQQCSKISNSQLTIPDHASPVAKLCLGSTL